MFAAGDLVVYGGEGVCRVERVGPSGMAYDDGGRLYYHLTPLYRSGTVLTPVDTGILMRPVITREAALALINWEALSQRYKTVYTAQPPFPNP